ncbi:DMT family transporter [Shewanella sp. 202IG2-18]|uniref:DMT family transporter n=1 Tax=Parashewanella hymeniacidonis TaxID=2807618 RepID=UPI001962046E|nr:DMT family transporter [Parashewanella hymeniacidonis]MBM7072594.1 DMT family transporter [Parashewanella hymeniacidonis]
MTAQRQGILIALFCVLVWASTASVLRLSHNSLDHFQFLFWSSLFSLIAVTVVSFYKGTLSTPFKYRRIDWVMTIGVGFVGTFLYYLFLYEGFSEGKGINVIIIQYTWPLMLSFLSVFLFKESLNWRKVIATTLGLCAVVIVLSKGSVDDFSLQNPRLLGFVALGALCFAIFNLGMKHLKLEATSLFVVFFSVATLCSFIAMLIKSKFIWPQGLDWFSVIFVGALINGLADLIWMWALRKSDASCLAPFVYFTPILAMMYLMVFFHEPFYPAYGIGLVLIVISGLLSTNMKVRLLKRKKIQAA